MKEFYIIKDIVSNEFYWNYRIEEGFTTDIKEATIFKTKDYAVEEIKKDYLQDLFLNRFIQIIKIYTSR